MTDDSVTPSDAPGETSISLLDRVRSRDEAAWRRLVSLYTPLVKYWCRPFDLQGTDRDDVVQEVFRSVQRGVARFRREAAGDTFRGWLRTITRNKVRDLLRRRRAEPVGAGGSDA